MLNWVDFTSFMLILPHRNGVGLKIRSHDMYILVVELVVICERSIESMWGEDIVRFYC